MKKLLKKRFLIPLIVVAIIAIGAVVAYAAFTSSATSTVTATTATLGVQANGTATDTWSFPAADRLVPASPVITVSGTPKVLACTAVSGGTPHTVAYTGDTAIIQTDTNVIAAYWHTVTLTNNGDVTENINLSAITAADGPSPGWASVMDTTVYTVSANGSGVLDTLDVGPTTVAGFTPPTMSLAGLAPGATATLEIGVWLDSSAGNAFQGGSPTITYTFSGVVPNS